MDQLEKNLNRIHEWIRAVDQKVSIFLAFQGIVMTLLVSNFDDFFLNNHRLFYCSQIKILLGLAGVCILFFSCYKSIMVIISRIKGKNKHDSFIFFGGIANMTLSEFKKVIDKASSSDYEKEYIDQIYISAKIAKRKHVIFQEAIILYAVGILVLGVYFLI